MAKTKLDRILEMLEDKATTFGPQGMPNTSTDTAVESAETTTTLEGSLNVEALPPQEPQVQEVPQDIPEAAEPQVSESAPSDDFDTQFAELEALLKADAQAPATPQAEVPVDAATSTETKESVEINDQNYQQLFDQEVERRIALEGEARQAAAEAKYRKNMFEKEGDKYYSHIDKQKELEAELRIAQAAAMPEQIAPLGQSYLLWKESQTPVHKYGALKELLKLAEDMTGVSAQNYYNEILRAENPDIPNVGGSASAVSMAQKNNPTNANTFVSL